MRKKENQTIGYALTHDDWSDLTVDQIAEVLDVTPASIHSTICKLKKKGIEVKYLKKSRGRPEEV